MDEAEAVFFGVGDFVQDGLALGLTGDGTGCGAEVQRVADLHGRSLFGQQVEEGFVDRSLNQNAGARDTDLSAVAEDASGGNGGGLLEVGEVAKDHVGRLAAEFEVDALEVRAGGVFQQPPTRAA